MIKKFLDYDGLSIFWDESKKYISSQLKYYNIVKVPTEDVSKLGTNIKEAYQLVDNENNIVGDTIKIYKDSSLKSVSLDQQVLKFTYILADGTESVVDIDVSKFLAESEFSDGLQVNSDGVVNIKIDENSDSYLTVSPSGLKLSGLQTYISKLEQDIKDLTDQLANSSVVVTIPSGISNGMSNNSGFKYFGLTEDIMNNIKNKVTSSIIIADNRLGNTAIGNIVYNPGDGRNTFGSVTVYYYYEDKIIIYKIALKYINGSTVYIIEKSI